MALFDNMPAGGMEQLKAALMNRQTPRPGGVGGAMMGNIPPEMQQRMRSLPMFGDLFAQMFAQGNPALPAQGASGGQPAQANAPTTPPPTPYTQMTTEQRAAWEKQFPEHTANFNGNPMTGRLISGATMPGAMDAPGAGGSRNPTQFYKDQQYFSVPGRTISESEYNQMQQNQPQQPALATPDTPATPTPAAQTAPQQPMAQPGQAATMGGNPYFMRRHPFAGVYS